MDNGLNDVDRMLWRKLIEAETTFIAARMGLFAKCSSLVEVVRLGLHEPTERASALGIAALLKVEDRQRLFADLLSLASFVSGSTTTARTLILSLPREWVLSNIEEYTEPLLHDGSYEEYRSLFELYVELDQALAYKLARRAAAHPDEDIREAGEDFLRRLNSM